MLCGPRAGPVAGFAINDQNRRQDAPAELRELAGALLWR